ncbi:MAG TPA: tRNA pseudouridine(55) synthase TruB [Casimicrobiaceae bacterium]|nr:tRNA pseudouridine(55) synthase TruB [Casimicrobiaceae bacterium]
MTSAVPREAGRGRWRRVDGVLPLDKPAGLSSNAALQRARRLYRAEKAGHTGTLDPLASGLLPVCFGEATKFAQLLLDSDKAYAATVRLGRTTTTGDAEGDPVEERPVRVSRDELEAMLPRFVGAIAQVPPRHAALKYRGRSYYRYAREGVEIPRAAREVIVHELTLERWAPPEIDLHVSCGKGTYIRSLAEDLGAALGCGAHLAALRRTRSGSLAVEAAISLEVLEADDEPGRDAWLLPVDTLLAGLPRLDLDPEQGRRLRCGQSLLLRELADGDYRAFAGGGFEGLVRCRAGVLQPRRLVASGDTRAARRG